jgi:ABC-type amino acid transport substrate-binding protein
MRFATVPVVFSLLLAGCAGGPIGDDAVRVGITPNYEPIAYERDGEIVGVEAELAEILADETGWKVELVRMDWDDLIPALRRRRIDIIMSGMSVTPGRSREVLFTEPYIEVGQMALIRSRDLARLGPATKIFLVPARIGYERGTTGEGLVRQRPLQGRLFGYDSVEEGVAALRAGEIDYFVHDAPTIWRFSSSSPEEGDLYGLFRPLTREELAWAVRLSEPDRKAELNRVLRRIQADGRLAEILRRHIGLRIEVR